MNKPFISLETSGHSNVVVFHDGHGGKTILADEGLDREFYQECRSEALRLHGKDLVVEFECWLNGLCSSFRHDHWKARLFNSLISQ